MSTDWTDPEKAVEPSHPKWRMSRRLRPYHSNPRRTRWLKTAAALTLVLGTYHVLSMFGSARQALVAKYTPTVYTHLTPEEAADMASSHWRWENQDSSRTRANYSREDVLASRDEWKTLGFGFEGEVFTYGDIVIKRYKSKTAPFRNCVPDASPELRWPTEIATSVMLGGMSDSASVSEDANFLPIVDYFLSPEEDDEPQAWHFLTPFLPSGNLAKLAERLRESDKEYTAKELDTIFRPSLNRLLAALDTMHTQHDLCHDDVKLDNIFLAPPADGAAEPNKTTHWLLADLGNARQPDHPYHTSILWSDLNDNLPDCRANDVLRLLKSYTLFLRSAVADRAAFDIDFFAAAEPWSRLFWATYDATAPVTATQTRMLSTDAEQPENKVNLATGPDGRQSLGLRSSVWGALLGWEAAMAKAADEALRVGAGDKATKVWGWVAVLGVPVGKCEARL